MAHWPSATSSLDFKPYASVIAFHEQTPFEYLISGIPAWLTDRQYPICTQMKVFISRIGFFPHRRSPANDPSDGHTQDPFYSDRRRFRLLYQWTMQPWRFVTEGITNPMDKCTLYLALRDPSDYLLVQYINGTIPPWNEYMALREQSTLLISIITWGSSDKN